MLKISDILKRTKGHKKGKEESVRKKPTFSKKPEPEPKPTQPPLPAKKIVDISPSGTDQPQEKGSLNEDQAFQIKIENQDIIDVYQAAIVLVKELMSPFTSGGKKLIKQADEVVKQFIEILGKEPDELLMLFFREYSVEKGYLYQHSVNVCILSLKMGLDLHYGHNHLVQLGLAALVHDIGLAKFDSLIGQPRWFNEQDSAEVRKHPLVGQNILKKFAQELDFVIFDVVRQEHERIDGTGYPYGLKKDDICEYAKIIGLVDAYEAIVHARPYRLRMDGREAIKELLTKKDAFDHNLVKNLINNLGVFAVGTLVELNTKEIGMVIKQNPKMPFRPVVVMTHSAEGQRLEKQKSIDLSVNFAVYIKDAITKPES